MVDEIKPWIELLGTPFGIVGVMLLALWRVARWLRPKADELFRRHIAFVDAAQKCNEDNSACIKEVRDSQKSIEKSIGEQSSVLKSITHALQRH